VIQQPEHGLSHRIPGSSQRVHDAKYRLVIITLERRNPIRHIGIPGRQPKHEQ
jgi:hypothetical protein